MYIIICRHKQSFPWTCDKHLFKENLKLKKKKKCASLFLKKLQTTLVGQIKSSVPVKIQGDCNSLDIVESEYNNQIAPSPTNVTEERIKLKTCISSKKVIYLLLITIYSTK